MSHDLFMNAFLFSLLVYWDKSVAEQQNCMLYVLGSIPGQDIHLSCQVTFLSGGNLSLTKHYLVVCLQLTVFMLYCWCICLGLVTGQRTLQLL